MLSCSQCPGLPSRSTEAFPWRRSDPAAIALRQALRSAILDLAASCKGLKLEDQLRRTGGKKLANYFSNSVLAFQWKVRGWPQVPWGCTVTSCGEAGGSRSSMASHGCGSTGTAQTCLSFPALLCGVVLSPCGISY